MFSLRSSKTKGSSRFVRLLPSLFSLFILFTGFFGSFVSFVKPAQANECCVCRTRAGFPPAGKHHCWFISVPSRTHDCSTVPIPPVGDEGSGFFGGLVTNERPSHNTITGSVCFPSELSLSEHCHEEYDVWEHQICEDVGIIEGMVSQSDRTTVITRAGDSVVSSSQAVAPTNQQSSVDEGTANFRSLTPVLSVPIPGVNFTPATLSGGEVTVPFLAQYILGVYRFAIGAAAILASIMVVYGGFRYLLGSTLGDVKEGKTVIQNAVIGLVVLLCSYVILQSVNPDLVNLRSLRLSYQERIVEPENEYVDAGAGAQAPGSTSGTTGGSSGYGIRNNTSPTHPPTSVQTVRGPSDECINIDGQVNPALVEPLREAGRAFCRLKASVPNAQSWKIQLGNSLRTQEGQFRAWLQNGCNSGRCAPTCNPFQPGYHPAPNTPEAELRQHLSTDFSQCPHTSGVALDIHCSGVPNPPASRREATPYVPCQLLLERAMIQGGFCRLRQENWHFELNSMRVSGNSCINDADIVGRIQVASTEPIYDYSGCPTYWHFSNRARETCSRVVSGATGSGTGSTERTNASIPPPRRGLPEASGGITGSQFALQLLGITDATIGARVLEQARNGRLDAAQALIPGGSRPLSESARENAIVEAITGHHYPGFLSQFIGINVSSGEHRGTFFVAPDMLAVGTNADYLRVPMSARAAQRIATNFGLLLPTKKMIDAMLQASNVQKEIMEGQSPFGGSRSHTLLYVKTNKLIQEQRNRHFDGSFHTAYIGGKKNVVIAPNMSTPKPRAGHTCPDLRVWIYGGLRSLSATDLQQEPTSIHDEAYFDYSHGINLIGAEMLVDGRPRAVSEVLADRTLAPLISDEMMPLHTSPVILDPRYPVDGPITVCSS